MSVVNRVIAAAAFPSVAIQRRRLSTMLPAHSRGEVDQGPIATLIAPWHRVAAVAGDPVHHRRTGAEVERHVVANRSVWLNGDPSAAPVLLDLRVAHFRSQLPLPRSVITGQTACGHDGRQVVEMREVHHPPTAHLDDQRA